MSLERTVAAIAVWVVPAALAYLLAHARFRARVRAILRALVSVLPLSAPFLMGVQDAVLRFLVAIQSVMCMSRAIDYCVQRPPCMERRGAFWSCLVYITFWPTLDFSRFALRFPAGAGARVVAFKAASATAKLAAAAALMSLGARLQLPETSFVLDAAFLAFEVFFLGGAMNDVTVASFGLAGFRLEEAFRYPLAHRSVLDFWGRYDLVFHHWLKRHVVAYAGGRRHPALAILAAFAVSGLAHEYLFLVVVPEVAGRQMAFFLLNALGGLCGARLGRSYRALFSR